MGRRNTQVNRQSHPKPVDARHTALERRVRGALGEFAPPDGMVGRIVAAAAARQSAHESDRASMRRWRLNPAALTACVAAAATLWFLMVADTCLAVGPEQAAMAQRLGYVATLLRFRLAEFANAFLRLFGAFRP